MDIDMFSFCSIIQLCEGGLIRVWYAQAGIQSRAFQRLRRIKQLGFSDFVYPGATHLRLLHSVGVFHTARRLTKVIEKYLPAKDARVDQALAAALVHDLGHGPFSHAFERIGERFDLKMANHEAATSLGALSSKR
jgi:HD superfamily phosphohydrolase